MQSAAQAMSQGQTPKPERLNPAERLAKAIVQIGIPCSIESLLAKGFSIEDVSRYWDEANQLASTKRPRPQ